MAKAEIDAGRARPGRVRGLDGLRGIASLIVVLRHTSNAVFMPIDMRRTLLESPLAFLFNAQGAVQLFFVLSGYVLATSLNRNKKWVDGLQFYVKRVFRIYPPYIAAVLLAWLASQFYVSTPDGEGLTLWIRHSLDLDISARQVLSSTLFPGEAYGLVPQGWTLRVEMIFSVLMPFLLFFARRFHWSLLVVAALLVFRLPEALGDLRYAIDFGLGIALFLERERLGRVMALIPRRATPLVVLVGVWFFASPMLLGWHEPIPGGNVLIGGFDPASIVLMGIGSAILVICAVYVPWMSLALSSRPIAFLGKISFSLYLLHRIFIALFAPHLAAPMTLFDALLLGALVLIVSIPTAALSYRFVERPSIRVGNRICTWLATRTDARSLTSLAGEVD